jgi:hypothetical protein
MRLDRPAIDPLTVRRQRQRLVGSKPLEARIEIETARPPLVEADLAASNRAQPVGGLTSDRQVQVARSQGLDALESKPRGPAPRRPCPPPRVPSSRIACDCM